MRARDNPFATACVHRIRYRFDGLNWDEFLRRLEQMHYRGAIVGPEGSGKTTLLEDLRPRLIERGFCAVDLRLTQEKSRFTKEVIRQLESDLTPRHILLLDGAEQMSRWGWWRFRRLTRRAGGLVITAHRGGLLKSVLNCGTTPDLLETIVRELLPGTPSISRLEVERLFVRHRGNLRDALRELYDFYAARAEKDKSHPAVNPVTSSP